jgi:myo-inositol-1-phosphate synthase
MNKIKIAIVGLGNCASSLVQGIHYYQNKNGGVVTGLMHWDIDGYKPCDIEVVAAFDIDKRKVGRDISEAIFAEPNCTTVFCKHLPAAGVKVRMGRILDGYSNHMRNYPEKLTFSLADSEEPSDEEVVSVLEESGAEILMNYLPVGSEEATKFYAECALRAGVGFINCIPVFIASDPVWAKRFKERNIPIIGDDIKSQFGATIAHRTLTDLFRKRGVKLERTYQLNTGGNTDFLNMLSRERLRSKKLSKTEAVQSVAQQRLDEENIHIGPSDYVPWQKDNKVCFIRMEGGVTIDAIRCCKLALERGEGGVLYAPSAYFMKHPPQQYTDDEAYGMTESFIKGTLVDKIT